MTTNIIWAEQGVGTTNITYNEADTETYLLQESLGFLLLEDGGKILLENAITSYITWSTVTHG